MHIRYRPALARLALTLVMIVFLVGLATLDANAEQRRVIVNGQVLSAKQLTLLDRLAGRPVPNGNYWIDPDTATWGAAGDPTPRGQIGKDHADPGQKVSDETSKGIYIGAFSPYRRDSDCILICSTAANSC